MISRKSFCIFTLFAIALTTVSGCSGGSKSTPVPPAVQSPTFTIGGAVAGLTGAGLVLQNNGGNNLAVSANATSFTFATPATSGSAYGVTVLTQPLGQSCTVTNASGTATASVTSVIVACTQLYTIGGTVTGLTGTGLVLEDNAGNDLLIGANATTFTFATPVTSGAAYSITVLTQPAGQNCTVTNGSGTTAAVNVTNVSVACTQTYTISGTVTGLAGTGLVLQDNGGNNLTVSANATTFAFSTPVLGGAAYAITALTQPAAESCTVTNGSGTVMANIGNVSIVCVGEWTWIGGSNVVGFNGGQAGVYGTLGTAAPANTPGGRDQATTWTDASGNLWLFGGVGRDSAGTHGELNDLWKFDAKLGASGQWTWMGGSTITPPSPSYQSPNGQPGNYGTLGTPSPANFPGGRDESMSWKDTSGNFWLFGGGGVNAASVYGPLSDLWEFNPTLGTSGEWTWMGGNSKVPSGGNHGVYGALGTPDAANLPGARYGGATWTDASGNFWLFGGNGFDENGLNESLNDLWKYTPGTNGNLGEWTWMGGSPTVPPGESRGAQTGQPGIYGTLGTAGTTNTPGGRTSAVSWIDASGNLWLFGGLGADSAGTVGYLNDLWKFDPTLGATGEWTWMGGSSTLSSQNAGPSGVYGALGTAASTNIPGGRFGATGWVDASGNLWLSGGQGYDWTDTMGYLNDLWKYTPSATGDTGQWTWMGGDSAVPNTATSTFPGQPGVYGILGTPGATDLTGGRYGAAAWTDASGNLWLFGGQGYDSIGAVGDLNDLWQYQP